MTNRPPRPAGRPQPGRVDNVIIAWNTLVARGLIDAAIAFDDGDLTLAGLQALEYLTSHVRGTDVPRMVGGRDRVRFLEDHTALAASCLTAYDATGDRTRPIRCRRRAAGRGPRLSRMARRVLYFPLGARNLGRRPAETRRDTCPNRADAKPSET